MYNEITVDRSLLYIDQHHVDTFKSLAKEMHQFSDIIEEGAFTKNDTWIVAFNTWLLLLPDECNIIQSVEKTVYYSPNFILLNALLKNSHFNAIKARYHREQKLCYLFSVVLANQLNQWGLAMMKKYNLMHLSEQNKKLSHYDAYKLPKKELQQFLENQALLTKAFIKEIHTTDTLQQTIKEAFDNASIVYSKHFLEQPHKA